MTLNFILVFSATVFIASIIPGPCMLLALNHGIKYGSRRTLATALGNLAATVVQASLSMAGLGVVMIRSESVFNVIKYAGAVYLVYIGIRIFFAPTGVPSHIERDNNFNANPGSLFLQAFVVTIGNPKAIVFFTALFPQFVDNRHNTILQFAVILVILAIIAFSSMMIYAVFGQKVMNLLNRKRVAKMFNQFTGLAFIGMGIGLVMDRSSL